MKTKSEVAAEYNLTANGTIRSPGKFRGEMWYVVALWDLVLDGGADLSTDDTVFVNEPTYWFKVDESLLDSMELFGENRAKFVALHPVGSWIGVFETGQGFVYLTSSLTDPSLDDSGEDPE